MVVFVAVSNFHPAADAKTPEMMNSSPAHKKVELQVGMQQ
jgi:hypothetical protein